MERERYEMRFWSSLRKLDARTGESGCPVSIGTTGIHSSGMERGNLSEHIMGALFTLKSDRSSLSISGSSAAYSPALKRAPGERNFHDPDTGSFRHVSAAGMLEYEASTFFFESALMNEQEYAAIAGASFRRSGTAASMLFRRYSPGYWALRAAAPSLSGNPANEEGVYAAFEAKLPFRIHMEASVDLARTLERTYIADMPVSREKILATFERKMFPRVTGRLTYRATRDSDAHTARESLVWKVGKESGKGSSVRWSALTAWSREGGIGGPYGETAVGYGKRGSRVEVSIGAFHIPSYQARFYRYEANVPGRGYTAAVWGKGVSAVTLYSFGAISFRHRVIRSDLMGRVQEITVQGDCGF
jgi:hypothetical protein